MHQQHKIAQNKAKQLKPPMWAHWLHLANTIELVLPSAHPSLQPSIGSAVFAQLTAECRRVHWCHLGNTIEIVHIGAIWQLRLNLCFLWPI